MKQTHIYHSLQHTHVKQNDEGWGWNDEW
jgi:hypothetical protein